MTDARVRIAADGYDAVGETFADWRDRITEPDGDVTFQWILGRT